MKTISSLTAVMAAVVVLSSSVSASGGHDRGDYGSHRHTKVSNFHHHHNGANWVVPLVVGGVLGYALSEPRRESVTYVSSRSPVVYAPQPAYQEQWVYFSDCDCQRKVLIPIR